LDKLKLQHDTYSCICSRKTIGNNIYPGTCRNGTTSEQVARSTRIKVDNITVNINDRLQGNYSQNLNTEVGDFIIKRADDYFSYHLATVVDDADQQITEIVRGVDLLDSTPRQVFLQNKLGLITPTYLHLPIAIDETGKKISKSIKPNIIKVNSPNELLYKALSFLGLCPTEQILSDDVDKILEWAIKNWKIESLPHKKEIMTFI
jgi:glutamyl-Q tRNA(Asp) synthetase